jgi:hypothetical protein
MHSLSTFGVRMNHGKPWTHKTHHIPNLGEATTFALIVYSVPLHKAHIQIAFCPVTSKWESWNSRVGTLATFGPHNFVCRPLIEMRSKAKLYHYRELSNNMSHTICTQGNRVDSQLLVIGSQIANLTHDFSFGHNLCFKCSNGSCEPILDIYVSIAFQWYK